MWISTGPSTSGLGSRNATDTISTFYMCTHTFLGSLVETDTEGATSRPCKPSSAWMRSVPLSLPLPVFLLSLACGAICLLAKPVTLHSAGSQGYGLLSTDL